MERLACKAMLTCLGWSNSVSSSMYDEQLINSIDKFRSPDDESFKTLCKVLRRPRGVTSTGEPDPGVKVNTRAESNSMLDVYFIKHQDRFSRDVIFINLTLAGVRKLASQREMEEDSTEGSIATPKVQTTIG